MTNDGCGSKLYCIEIRLACVLYRRASFAGEEQCNLVHVIVSCICRKIVENVRSKKVQDFTEVSHQSLHVATCQALSIMP